MKYVLWAMLLTLVLTANAAELAVQGRVGITGTQVPLKPGTAAGNQAKITNAVWRQDPAQAKLYLTAYFTATDEWQRGVMTFTPQADGKVEVYFTGAFNPDRVQTWVWISNIEVTGVALRNADFAQGLKDWRLSREKEQSPTLSDDGKDGAKAVKVSHDCNISQWVEVKADQEITIAFWFKSAQ